MGFLSDNFISEGIVFVLKWVFELVNDYSITIILLTIAIKLVTMPLDLKQRASMRKTSAVAAEVAGIKKRYANAPDQANRKVQELYRERNIKPTAGCLPMAITMILLFAFFGALRVIASEQTVGIVLDAVKNGAQNVELPNWLWVHNFWQPDSGFAGCLPTTQEFTSFLMQNSNYITPQTLMLLKNAGLVAFDNGVFSVVASNYEAMCSTIISANGLTGLANGWFGLPLLAGVSLFFNQWYTQKKNPNTAMAEQQAGMNKMMLYFFPLFSVYICATSNTAFAVYWLVSNLYMTIFNLIVNLYYKKKEEKNPVLIR